ncbi:MAG: hypothetical protein NWR72_05760, partial [Bacteroidia bacterium]|nr:hypothetical protein [Bacteroidia bacterium]
SRGSSAGQRTTGNALPTQSGRSIESYAGVTYVGSLTEVDPMSYLRFSRSVQNPLNTSTSTSSANQRQGSTRGGTTTTPNPDELWRYTYTTTGSANSNTAINARTTQQSSIQTGTTWNNNVTVDQQRILVNVAIALPLTNRPGKSSPAIGQLGYGEAAYRVAGVAPSIQQGEQYVQVQTINGQVGWLPVSMLVEDGRLGVVIANVAGVANSGAPVSFFAAEPVVLARYENGRALIVGKDGKKAGWIANLNALSISEEDLHIADMIAEAMSHTSIYARRARLRDIQNHPTYYDSALKPVVDRLVVEEAQRN